MVGGHSEGWSRRVSRRVGVTAAVAAGGGHGGWWSRRWRMVNSAAVAGDGGPSVDRGAFKPLDLGMALVAPHRRAGRQYSQTDDDNTLASHAKTLPAKALATPRADGPRGPRAVRVREAARHDAPTAVGRAARMRTGSAADGASPHEAGGRGLLCQCEHDLPGVQGRHARRPGKAAHACPKGLLRKGFLGITAIMRWLWCPH